MYNFILAADFSFVGECSIIKKIQERNKSEMVFEKVFQTREGMKSMVYEFSLQTQRQNFCNITEKVREAVKRSGVQSGICVVFCPHTTAGITINENADPDVVRDMLLGLEKAYPHREQYRHMEGNSAAHLKASAIGSSATVIVQDGELLLGVWQGIYFGEFDGPRTRRVCVKVMGE